MSDSAIIRFENVSKRFDFSRENSSGVMQTVFSGFRRNKEDQDAHLWAVNDVSFDIMPGQCVGIVGRNGSGKSTALKLAARILRPTDGRIVTRGRLSALLELGAGFHDDLSGRENIYLNGSLFGLERDYIDKMFDDIVAFSELGEFIEMPVKHYSSGMYMRLGFSVAIHVDPDILIVDEILAVGDRAFQMKCIERIKDLKEKGVTIVFVSHNLDMVRRLCTHLIWLEKGHLKAIGPIDEVAELYAAYSHSGDVPKHIWAEKDEFERHGSGEIEITAVRLLNDDGDVQFSYKTGDALTIEMDYLAHVPIKDPEFGIAIARQDGLVMTSPNNLLAKVETGVVSGSGTIRYHIPDLPFLAAHYLVTVAIHDSQLSFAYDYHKSAYPFRVSVGGTDEFQGLVYVPAVWEWLPNDEAGDSTTPPNSKKQILGEV